MNSNDNLVKAKIGWTTHWGDYYVNAETVRV